MNKEILEEIEYVLSNAKEYLEEGKNMIKFCLDSFMEKNQKILYI